MTTQSNATENIARDEMYNISKKMLTVNLSTLIGLQSEHRVYSAHILCCVKGQNSRAANTVTQHKAALCISPDVWKVVCLEIVGHKQA